MKNVLRMKITPTLYQLPNHPLYRKVDWSLVQSGKYAVVNPMDGTNILYLTPSQFSRLVMVCLSNEGSSVEVLASSGDKPSSEGRSSPDTPTSSKYWVSTTPLFTRSDVFVTPFNSTNGWAVKDSSILLESRNAFSLFRIWFSKIILAAGKDFLASGFI